jgi:hypothetical protein
MKITTVGIDLTKNVFQVHAVDECPLAAVAAVALVAIRRQCDQAVV